MIRVFLIAAMLLFGASGAYAHGHGGPHHDGYYGNGYSQDNRGFNNFRSERQMPGDRRGPGDFQGQRGRQDRNWGGPGDRRDGRGDGWRDDRRGQRDDRRFDDRGRGDDRRFDRGPRDNERRFDDRGPGGPRGERRFDDRGGWRN